MIMSPNDQSFLSAFVDGELDPDEQRAVEAALVSDPHLAEAVQGLLRVRDQVAELPRPLPPDLSVQVMDRIHHRARSARPWNLARRYAPWSLGGIAAGIALLLILPHLQRHPAPAPVHAPNRNDDRSLTNHPSELASAERPQAITDRSALADVRKAERSPTGSPDPVASTRAGDSAQDSYQARVGELLSDKRLQRVFLVTDSVREPAEQQVLSLVERTTHHDCYKITVAQGIVIDPRHPGKATVFAVVLDQNELDPFRRRLRDTFKDRLEDNEIDPAVAMQLVDIGQVVTLPAHPIGEVTIPSATLALKSRPDATGITNVTSPPPPEAEPARPTLEQERSDPVPVLAQEGQGQAADGGTPADSEPAVDSSSSGQNPARAANPRHRLDTANRGSSPSRDGLPSVPPARRQAEKAGDLDQRLVVLVWISEPGSG
jgi:hypothetical protein